MNIVGDLLSGKGKRFTITVSAVVALVRTFSIPQLFLLDVVAANNVITTVNISETTTNYIYMFV